MAKQECYAAFMALVSRQNLDTQTKLAKVLGIKGKEAKDLLNGNLDNYDQHDIIKLTSVLITQRIINGTQKKT